MEWKHQHNRPTSSGETQIPNGGADQQPISVGETLPSAAPECMEAPTDWERRRGWGRRILDALLFETWRRGPDSSAPPFDETNDVAQQSTTETSCDERTGETPMPTGTLDQVIDGSETVFYETDDERVSLIHGPRSGVGNRWFNALPSLNVEVSVGLSNSYSDIWVNIPDVYPPSAEDVELQQRGYAQISR